MEIEELKAELEKFKSKAESLEDEKRRILSKNEELLDETKRAKSERNELKEQFTNLQSQFEELQHKAEHGEETMEKVNELVQKKLEIIQADFEQKLEEATQKATQFEQQYNNLFNNYAQEKVSSQIRAAAEKAGVIPTAIDDVVLRANQLFKLNEEGKIEARDSEGNLLKAGKKILTPEVFMEQLQEKAPHFWPASEGSGMQGNTSGGGYQGKNPFAKESLNYTEQVKLTKSDPELAERLKQEAQSA